ncbi:MAG: hypothetical protein RQ723_07875 [Desulfuromonadales bacterium]|nr:hypothetical protein [Desulfuromonadales bacterium]
MKMMKVLLAALLVAALATPALAEFKLNGYYRTQMYSGEFKSTTDKDGDSQQWTTQRFRAKLTYSLNDNVSVVYYGEVDADWGLQSKGSIGNGGRFGADGVNVETKNVYLDTKFDNTHIRLGTQGIADGFDGIVVNADMTGVLASQNYGKTKLTAFYSKWDEGSRSDWDGTDFYGAKLEQTFTDTLKGSFQIYYVAENDADGNDTATADLFYFGPRLAFVMDNFTLDGFVVFQDGEFEDNTVGGTDIDTFAYVGSLKASMKIDGGDLNFRFIYGSENDDDKDADFWMADFDQYAFVNENQMLFLIDPYVTDWAKENYALNDSLKQGYGLMAFILSGNHKLPENMYAKWGLGYYMAVDDNPDGAAKREGDSLGFEVAARVGKKFFEKVDVSLNGAYASFGDFYDNTVNGTDDPDSIYKVYAMVNVPF